MFQAKVVRRHCKIRNKKVNLVKEGEPETLSPLDKGAF
jgi:hypothetical protein